MFSLKAPLEVRDLQCILLSAMAGLAVSAIHE